MKGISLDVVMDFLQPRQAASAVSPQHPHFT